MHPILQRWMRLWHWQTLLPQATIFPISALTGFGVEDTLSHLKSLLPPSPPYFPKDQFTDKPERFFVNEAIREQILEQYDKEIPYAVEVTTDAFVEEAALIRIRSVIMVERESQGILIGHKGSALKRVGVGAEKIRSFLCQKNSPGIIRESQQRLAFQRKTAQAIRL